MAYVVMAYVVMGLGRDVWTMAGGHRIGATCYFGAVYYFGYFGLLLRRAGVCSIRGDGLSQARVCTNGRPVGARIQNDDSQVTATRAPNPHQTRLKPAKAITRWAITILTGLKPAKAITDGP